MSSEVGSDGELAAETQGSSLRRGPTRSCRFGVYSVKCSCEGVSVLERGLGLSLDRAVRLIMGLEPSRSDSPVPSRPLFRLTVDRSLALRMTWMRMQGG